MAKDKLIKAISGSEKTPLKLGAIDIPCYVLSNGERVLSRNGMQKALGFEGTSGDWLIGFVKNKSLNKHISAGLLDAINNPLQFERVGAGGSQSKTYGHEATLLIDLCDAIIEAKNAGDLKRNQLIYAQFAEIIIRSVAKVGIVALVDEATGYQYEREKDALQLILKAYISEALLPWEKRFPDEFYREIFRLNHWDFTVTQIKTGQRPGVIGKWTKKYIYSVLPKGVLQALLNQTPRNEQGKLIKKLHQKLTREQGIEHLNKQIISAVTLMNVSDSWKDFERLWNKKFGQQELQFADYELLEPPKKQNEELSIFNKNLAKALNHNPKN